MMSLWDALRMNMMISYQELVRTFLRAFIVKRLASLLLLSLATWNKFANHLLNPPTFFSCVTNSFDRIKGCIRFRLDIICFHVIPDLRQYVYGFA